MLAAPKPPAAAAEVEHDLDSRDTSTLSTMGDAPIVDASLSPLVATESLGSMTAAALEAFDELSVALPNVLVEKARGRKRSLSERDRCRRPPFFFLAGVSMAALGWAMEQFPDGSGTGTLTRKRWVRQAFPPLEYLCRQRERKGGGRATEKANKVGREGRG